MTQTVHVQTFDYGASLSSATLRNLTTDALVATADTTAEVTADGGLYAIVFDEVSPIAAGTYRVRAIVGGQPLQRYATLAAVDGEIVQAQIQAGLATAAALAVVDDRTGWTLAALAGACADAGTAAETYTITLNTDTYTIDHTGLNATGNRGTATLSKT